MSLIDSDRKAVSRLAATTHAQLRAVLLAHMKRYPAMEPCDGVKLVYQNEFGGGHLIRDEEESLQRLYSEYTEVHHAPALPLWEEIGNGLVRVMLAAVDQTRYPLDELNRDFIRSANLHSGTRESFEEKLFVLTKLARSGLCPFSASALEAYLEAYRQAGYPPVSHSPAYRAAYQPAYRVVRKDCLPPALLSSQPAASIWSAALDLLQDRPRAIVAIDGRCASGKSTLAAQLQETYGCCVIHMDHFFLRPEQRTPLRYDTPGENIDHERFLQEVLLPLTEGMLPSYRPFHCGTQTLGEPIQISDFPIVVVEGSYSCHPVLREWYDLRIFLSVEPELQMNRICLRNGRDYAQVFREKWIPLEELYFSQCEVETCCQLHFTAE